MGQKNIILVGGGDSFSKHEDFLNYLKQVELRDVPSDTQHKSWKLWLKEELGEEYYFAIPQMPNKQNAQYGEWKIWFERHLGVLGDGPLTLIGLSLGAQFLAKYLIENDLDRKLHSLFLLAGPCGYYEDPNGMDCASFGFESSKLAKLETKAEKIYILHSKDDFVVPYEHALKYKEALPEAELVTFADKNHFLVEELPELVNLIKAA